MYRKMESKLLSWKKAEDRKPLLLYGARQTGKTYLVDAFAGAHYQRYIRVNFEKMPAVSRIFEGDLQPVTIIRQLENYFDERIVPENTLIFFDEIQACPAAVMSLKYFREDAPQYAVIGAGSLLGVALNRNRHFSFPVGKVDELKLYPMDFLEFLTACGNEMLAETIRAHYHENRAIAPLLHEKALSLYRSYLVLGGMPEVVNTFVETGSYVAAVKKLETIHSGYIKDTAKYCSATEAVKHKSCYESIAKQLLKENKNFKYAVVQHGKNAAYFGTGIDWLVNMGIALKSRLLETSKIPLEVHVDNNLFRLYFSDVGLFRHRMRTPVNDILDIGYRDDVTGILAENYVACELTSAGIPLYYWKGKNSAEIEFMLEKDRMPTPLEVKAGKRVTSKSLRIYQQQHKTGTVYRLSGKNFGLENGVRSVPLYAVFCLTEELQRPV